MKMMNQETKRSGIGFRKSWLPGFQIKHLRLLVISYLAVLIMLGVSLSWNIQQAIDSGAYSQQSYKNGLRDGETFTRVQILRAELEAEIIADQRAELAKEKL